MKEAWQAVRVPIFGVIGIVLVTLIAFAVVKPSALTVQRPVWSITGNAIVDSSLYDGHITLQDGCAQVSQQVCGTDGKTYLNFCEARKAGVDMRYQGACQD